MLNTLYNIILAKSAGLIVMIKQLKWYKSNRHLIEKLQKIIIICVKPIQYILINLHKFILYTYNRILIIKWNEILHTDIFVFLFQNVVIYYTTFVESKYMQYFKRQISIITDKINNAYNSFTLVLDPYYRFLVTLKIEFYNQINNIYFLWKQIKNLIAWIKEIQIILKGFAVKILTIINDATKVLIKIIKYIFSKASPLFLLARRISIMIWSLEPIIIMLFNVLSTVVYGFLYIIKIIYIWLKSIYKPIIDLKYFKLDIELVIVIILFIIISKLSICLYSIIDQHNFFLLDYNILTYVCSKLLILEIIFEPLLIIPFWIIVLIPSIIFVGSEDFIPAMIFCLTVAWFYLLYAIWLFFTLIVTQTYLFIDYYIVQPLLIIPNTIISELIIPIILFIKIYLWEPFIVLIKPLFYYIFISLPKKLIIYPFLVFCSAIYNLILVFLMYIYTNIIEHMILIPIETIMHFFYNMIIWPVLVLVSWFYTIPLKILLYDVIIPMLWLMSYIICTSLDYLLFISSVILKILLNTVVNTIIIILFILIGGIIPLIERKYLSLIQRRIGPKYIGYNGRLQFIADAMKLLLKELIYLKNANRFILIVLPIIALIINLFLMVNIIWLKTINIYDNNCFFLQILVIELVSTIIYIYIGFFVKNKYTILASTRLINGTIVFEIFMFTIYLYIYLMYNQLNFYNIAGSSLKAKFLYFALLVPYLINTILLLLKKVPYDIIEAETELIMGYSTEHSGFLSGSLLLIEYLHLFFWSFFLLFVFIF